MNLRQLAENDLSFILEDGIRGFGWPIILTAPNGDAVAITGYSDDIAQFIDADTGQSVSGRFASVALRISSLNDIPEGISDSQLKPWLVDFSDINGSAYTFKVAESNPDRALGIVTCLLELYQ